MSGPQNLRGSVEGEVVECPCLFAFLVNLPYAAGKVDG